MGILVQTTPYGMLNLKKIVETKEIAKQCGAIGCQIPEFKDVPLSYCSYICEGYQHIYGGDREGVIFETDSPVVYACPSDIFFLMRERDFIPGYEKFIFPSIEKMVEKYPTWMDFKEDFLSHYKSLKPEEIFLRQDEEEADSSYEVDIYYIGKRKGGCNEITFKKPTKVKNVQIFESRKELEKIMLGN